MAHTFLGIDYFSSTPASSGHGVWTDGTSTDDNDPRDAASANLNAEAALNRTNWNRWHMINWIDGGSYTATTAISTQNVWNFKNTVTLTSGATMYIGSIVGTGTISVGAYGTITLIDSGYMNITASTTAGGINFVGSKAEINGDCTLKGGFTLTGSIAHIHYRSKSGPSTTSNVSTLDTDTIEYFGNPGGNITWTLGAPLNNGRTRLNLFRHCVGASVGNITIVSGGKTIGTLPQGNDTDGALSLEFSDSFVRYFVVGSNGNATTPVSVP